MGGRSVVSYSRDYRNLVMKAPSEHPFNRFFC